MTCRFNIEVKHCRAANPSLVKAGFEALPVDRHCIDCALDERTKEVLDEFPEAGEQRKAAVRRWLNRMGFSTTNLDRGPPFQTGFRCPVIRETICAPCSLEQCAYHIDYPFAANCVLAYMHQQGVDALSADEIAYLYQRPVEDVKKLIDSATQVLRAKAIEVESHDDEALQAQFRYLQTDQVCCVCESAIEDWPNVPRAFWVTNTGLAYCSKECRDEKPPRLIELELERGIPIGKILDWTFSNYRSVSLAEQSLNMPRWLVSDACRRFLGKRIEDYFPPLKNSIPPKRASLSRRTWHTPAWVNSMIQKVRPVAQQIQQQFGPSSVRLASIKRQLGELLENL
jgi:hypothetical protein